MFDDTCLHLLLHYSALLALLFDNTLVSVISYLYYSAILLLLHCYYTVITLLLHCYYTVITLLYSDYTLIIVITLILFNAVITQSESDVPIVPQSFIQF